MSNNCPSLGNYVYNDLLNRIGTGEFQVNARLPSEEHLAKSYKVSRPIVREALARLREDGVIHSRRGAGSFIIRIPQPLLNSNEKNMKDWMELLHCYEFRTVLEGNMPTWLHNVLRMKIRLASKQLTNAYTKTTIATLQALTLKKNPTWTET